MAECCCNKVSALLIGLLQVRSIVRRRALLKAPRQDRQIVLPQARSTNRRLGPWIARRLGPWKILHEGLSSCFLANPCLIETYDRPSKFFSTPSLGQILLIGGCVVTCCLLSD